MDDFVSMGLIEIAPDIDYAGRHTIIDSPARGAQSFIHWFAGNLPGPPPFQVKRPALWAAGGIRQLFRDS